MSGIMSERHKMVPVEPTDAELLAFAAEEQFFLFCDEDGFLQIAHAVIYWYARRQRAQGAGELAAAPDVQGEPVAYAVLAGNGNIRIWCADPVQVETLRQKYGEALQPLYTTPPPQPDVTALVEALRSILGWRELRSGNEFPVERIEEIARAALAVHRTRVR